MQHLVIGAFVFSVSAHTPLTKFTRTTKGAFSEVPLVDNATSEKTGRPLETIDITAKWLRYGAHDNVEALRGLIDEPQQVSNGQGENLGRWTIKSLTEGKTDFVHDGRNMVTEVSLQLLEYRGES
ncbi:phage tail protein [Photobacterium sp.]|uniref:phage tail protein n=1 Tax=Photobacterium sp. TaxID=660 RepID=UPI00299EF6E5|nr:phage tail protein [Photobacterium sp.]MDX1301835.1 phage tail protein [Photobacterium sp.]